MTAQWIIPNSETIDHTTSMIYGWEHGEFTLKLRPEDLGDLQYDADELDAFMHLASEAVLDTFGSWVTVLATKDTQPARYSAMMAAASQEDSD
jgi:hypothetical protein